MPRWRRRAVARTVAHCRPPACAPRRDRDQPRGPRCRGAGSASPRACPPGQRSAGRLQRVGLLPRAGRRRRSRGGNAGGPHREVVGELGAQANLPAVHLERERPIGCGASHLDDRPGHESAVLEVPHHVGVQLEVFGQSLQHHPLAGAAGPQRDQVGVVDGVSGAGDRVAMDTGGGVVQDHRQALLDFVRDGVLPDLRLFMGAVPWEADHLHQEALGEAMTADDVPGELLAGGGESQLAAPDLNEPVAAHPLHRLGDRSAADAHPTRQLGLHGGDGLLGHLVDRGDVVLRRRRADLARHGPSLQSRLVASARSSSTETPPRRLFLLDGHSLSYRAYFALPPTLATTSGQVTNAAYGFTSMLIKLLGEEHPDLIAVAFNKGKPTVRLEQYPEYKAGRRETPDDFKQQLPLIREVVETLRIPIVEVEGYEADDAIATLAVRAGEMGIEVVIV